MPSTDDLVVVYSSQGPLGAEVVRSKLAAEGLPVMLRYQAVGRVLGLTVDGLGRVEVCVRPEDELAARAILEQAEPDESPDIAPASED